MGPKRSHPVWEDRFKNMECILESRSLKANLCSSSPLLILPTYNCKDSIENASAHFIGLNIFSRKMKLLLWNCVHVNIFWRQIFILLEIWRKRIVIELHYIKEWLNENLRRGSHFIVLFYKCLEEFDSKTLEGIFLSNSKIWYSSTYISVREWIINFRTVSLLLTPFNLNLNLSSVLYLYHIIRVEIYHIIN